ncbi:MAG: HDOD domain-containing protein [bacterium]|nr:HDOD domain-containing protein [bacterium]
MSDLVITCQCGQRMKARSDLLGKTAKCVRCGVQLTVTEENTQPLPAREPEGPADSRQPESEPSTGHPRIGELLVEDGLVTQGQVDEALGLQKKRGGRTFEILLSLGYLDKEALHDFLSRQSGVASIDIQNYDIPKDLLELVPREMAKEHLVFPIDKMGRLLTIGMACPLDLDTIAALQESTGLRVKPMLCRLDDILATIGRYYPEPEPEEAATFAVPGGGGVATAAAEEEEQEDEQPAAPPTEAETPVEPPAEIDEEVLARVRELDSLPSYADTTQRVREAFESPECSVRDMAAIVACDPAVTVQLLSVANAEAYGMAGRVTTIDLASALLGIDGICEIVISSRMEGAVQETGHFEYATFAMRSLFVALASRGIAATVRPELEGEAYAAGLVHAIGRLALAQCFPEDYGSLNGGLEGAELAAAELARFGIDYPRAGHALAQKWRLPEAVADSIQHHLSDEMPAGPSDLAAVVALAAFMADLQKHKTLDEPDAFAPRSAVMQALGLNDAEAVRIATEALDLVSRRM